MSVCPHKLQCLNSIESLMHLSIVWDMLFLVSVLQYEPNNATAKEFYPFIVEKLHLSEYSFNSM